jgi:hypothetical protein
LFVWAGQESLKWWLMCVKMLKIWPKIGTGQWDIYLQVPPKPSSPILVQFVTSFPPPKLDFLLSPDRDPFPDLGSGMHPATEYVISHKSHQA